MSKTDRPGEIQSALDPAALPGDARLVFIGRARTLFTDRESCPKNMRQARQRGGAATIEIDPPWRPGLKDIEPGALLIVLTWLDRARRDLVVQAPRHREAPVGVFSLRSPVRPNPIGLHVVRLLACDGGTGLLAVDALDCLDGTPVLDVKPWIAGVDAPTDAPYPGCSEAQSGILGSP